ncbi:MAG: hypothetical protein EHM45_18395, partial [Desulfobacteraceae bacterium]
YNIYRTDAAGKTVKNSTTAAGLFFDKGLTPGATYIYNVSAYNNLNKESALTPNQTVTLPNTQVSAGYKHVVGLKKNGTVVAAGDPSSFTDSEDNDLNEWKDVNQWKEIVQVAAGYYHTVGLTKDGRVVAVGDPSGYTDDKGHHVNEWKDIVQIAAGTHTVGLDKEGNVWALGDNIYGQCDVSEWKNIQEIAAQGQVTLGLWKDGVPQIAHAGRDLYTQFNTMDTQWSQLVQVSTSVTNCAVLHRSGTVWSDALDDDEIADMNKWPDSRIKQVTAGYNFVIGLTEDNKIVTSCKANGNCRGLEGTENVARLSSTYYHDAVALKNDGKVVFSGPDGYGQNEAAQWNLNDITGPAKPVLTAGTKTSTTLTFSWSAVTDDLTSVKGYAIYRNGNLIGATTGLTYTDRGLRPSGTFEYNVIAYDIMDNLSATSNTLTMTTAAPTNTAMIAAGDSHTVGLKKNGLVVAAGKATSYSNNQGGHVNKWVDIVQIAAGPWHTVGLKKGGTAVAVGSNDFDQCTLNSTDWQNIVQIAAGSSHTVGLKNDGTVVAAGDHGGGRCDVDIWNDNNQDILQVAAGAFHTVGLTSGNTVVAVGDAEAYSNGERHVNQWKDIVQVAAGYNYTVGLTKYGTVLAEGIDTRGTLGVEGWTDIVQIWAGGILTVGLKSDGNIVATGYDALGCDGYTKCLQDIVDSLNMDKDIVQFSSFGNHAVFLKKTGAVKALYENGTGACEVSGWNLNDASVPDGVTVLNNGQSLSNLSASSGKWLYYKIEVPAGAENLVVKTSGGTGDADLYLKFGSKPTTSSFDGNKSDGSSNTETCTITDTTSAGFWYIGIYASKAFSKLTLTVSYP